VRIGLITTIDTNIGDALIRDGICRILRGLFPRRDLEFVMVNKHDPLTVYPGWHPAQAARLARYLPRGKTRAGRAIESLAAGLNMSRFAGCDVIVQCGTPVFWPGCHGCEWAVPIWHHVVGRLSDRIPVLNLAAGSCYPWERQPEAITDPEDAGYIRAITSYCRVTTVRDRLALTLLRSMNIETSLVPCTALLAADGPAVRQAEEARRGGMVLINYMHGGGHYDCGQGIRAEAWADVVRNLIGRLRRRHSLAFLCHDGRESDLAKGLDPGLPRLLPRNTGQYFEIVSRAKLAICNRMHASVALAGIGVPSVAVCTDTRLLMVEALGLPCLYVKDTDPNLLEGLAEDLLERSADEAERLSDLRGRTWDTYTDLVGRALESHEPRRLEPCLIKA
jgi:polysaccharide pyruvyl transferase WcaK-like protein